MKTFISKVQNLGHNPPSLLPESPNIPPWPTFASFDASTTEQFRYRKQVGVNLGSVFALEAWLCPAQLKNAVAGGHWSSELDFLSACRDHQQARELLEYHWTSFITAQDMATLASWGITAVRIPFGYWMVEPRTMVADYPRDPFYQYADVYDAALPALMQLVYACEQNDIGVLLDIHGAPGGQNSDAHCGQRTPCSSHFFSTTSNQNQTCLLRIIQRLTQLFSPINNIIGIELLNEPTDHSGLPKFYARACQMILNTTPTNQRPLPVYIGDCWKPGNYMDIIAHQLSNAHPFVVLDTHQYFCHTASDHKLTAQQNTTKVEQQVGGFLERQGPTIRQNIVVGEWAMVLNGASMKGLDERKAMTDFGTAEARVWDRTCAGNFYWTYKTADDKWYWSMRYCQQQGLLPWLKKRQPHNTDTLQQKRDQVAQQQTASHLEYWKQQLATKEPASYTAIEQHVWMYEKGFKAGYNAACLFAQRGHTIGFKSQLAKDHLLEESWDQGDGGGDVISSFGWQYEQAFVKAINLVEQEL
ncbi:unnamed protein product [Absidia cylindrospora]